MKKIQIILVMVLAVASALVLGGCNRTVHYPIETPSNVEFVDGILSWDYIENVSHWEMRFRRPGASGSTRIWVTPDRDGDRKYLDMAEFIGLDLPALFFRIDPGDQFDISLRARYLTNPGVNLWERVFEDSAWTSEMRWVAE